MAFFSNFSHIFHCAHECHIFYYLHFFFAQGPPFSSLSPFSQFPSLFAFAKFTLPNHTTNSVLIQEKEKNPFFIFHFLSIYWQFDSFSVVEVFFSGQHGFHEFQVIELNLGFLALRYQQKVKYFFVAMDFNTDSTPYLSLFAAFSYGVASMAMVFINKAVVMQYTHSMTLLTLQQLMTTLLIRFGRAMGYTKARGFNVENAKKLLLVSLFYNANVAFALASLKGINIPMYIAIKRLTPLAVLIAGFFYGKGRPTTQVTLSVLLTAAGVLVAALGDFSFDLSGYSMAFTSVFFQTMYLILVEKTGAEDGLSSVEIMFYNSILSIPFLLFLIIATGEFPNSISLLFAKSASLSFLSVLLLSLVMGIVLNYTMFLCTIVNSALTTTIVGVLKGVGSTTIGFFLLGGVKVHALNVTGLLINTAGGVWYSFAKYQQKKNKLPKLMSDVETHRK
ncbi:Nucleotide-sugar transporter VRG4/SQV-7 [Handroanthus impetiginosus]|uniref:Nucleotide-sugar transporter VRG4/SQV-7 n=1 Tax=Handroanthus impetiginosus TaxID=429701 RepID=A0A2G9GLL3_9LAMI|nr:Nucleotide-sugar transporter VRG4/SQV-7 [Handroanthus impetiginosus]